ncbi:MAG: aquaporin [Anaerolineales bacterium]|nr:aquaporin [Anaerolineales bacterium]
MFNSKVFVAEFIGTFALVFIGAGAGMVGAGLVGIALAYGFTLAVFYYVYGHISGAHVNPAVTFALALNNTVKWGQAAFYWIAQFAGAILAAWLLQTIAVSLGGTLEGAATTGLLTEKEPIFAMVVEAILTFLLVNTILNTAVAGNGGNFAGWAIGTTFALAILGAGTLTGASLNPARTFGIAIFAGPSYTNVYTYVIYLFGPLIGATLAVLVYNFLNDIKDEEDLELEELEYVLEEEPVQKTVKKARKPAVRKTAKK